MATRTITINASTNPTYGGKINFSADLYTRTTLDSGDPQVAYDDSGIPTTDRIFAFFDLSTDPTSGGTITKVELLATVSSVSGTHAVDIVSGDANAGPGNPSSFGNDEVLYAECGPTGDYAGGGGATATPSAGAVAIQLGGNILATGGQSASINSSIANGIGHFVGISLSNEAAAGSVVFDASVGFGLRITYEEVMTYGPSTPTRDTRINEFAPTENYGVTTQCAVLSPFAGQRSAALLAFDVTSIPVGSTVSSATLLFKVAWNTLGAPQAAHVFALTRLFTEGTESGGTTNTGATWNKYNSAAQGGNNWTTAGGDWDATNGVAFNIPTGTSPLSIDVTTAVQQALDNHRISDIISLIVRTDATLGANQGAAVYLKEDGTASNRPTLEITYTEPSSLVGGSLMLLGVGK